MDKSDKLLKALVRKNCIIIDFSFLLALFAIEFIKMDLITVGLGITFIFFIIILNIYEIYTLIKLQKGATYESNK